MVVPAMLLSIVLAAGGVTAVPCADPEALEIPGEVLADPPLDGAVLLTESGFEVIPAGGTPCFNEGSFRLIFTHNCCVSDPTKEDVIVEQCQGGVWVYYGQTCKVTPNCN